MKGRYKIITQEQGKNVNETPWIHNLVLEGSDTGLGLIFQSLGGGVLPISITSLEIGTGSTAPTISDTNLVSPTLTGIAIRTKVVTPTSITFSFFLNSNDLPNGTYRELLLRAGTKAFARSLISPVFTKGTNQDAIVVYEIAKA